MSEFIGLVLQYLGKFSMLPIELRSRNGSLVKRLVLRELLLKKTKVRPGKYIATIEPLQNVSVSVSIMINKDGNISVKSLNKFASELRRYLITAGSQIISHIEESTVMSSIVDMIPNEYHSIVSLINPSIDTIHDQQNFYLTISGTEAAIRADIIGGVPLKEDSKSFDSKSIKIINRKNSIEVSSSVNKPSTLSFHVLGRDKLINIILIKGFKVIISPNIEGDLYVKDILYDDDTIARIARFRTDGQFEYRNSLLLNLTEVEISDICNSSWAAALRLAYAFVSVTKSSDDLAHIMKSRASLGVISEFTKGVSSDSQIILSELLSYEEKNHLDAFKIGVNAIDFGLPIFSIGLNYLIGRLNTYRLMARDHLQTHHKTSPLREHVRQHATSLTQAITLLRPFAATCNFEVAPMTWLSKNV